jgi:ribosomal protein S14
MSKQEHLSAKELRQLKASMRCSFCGRERGDVPAFVRGPPGAAICSICVDVCAGAIADGLDAPTIDVESTTCTAPAPVGSKASPNKGAVDRCDCGGYLQKLKTVSLSEHWAKGDMGTHTRYIEQCRTCGKERELEEDELPWGPIGAPIFRAYHDGYIDRQEAEEEFRTALKEARSRRKKQGGPIHKS